MMSSVVPVFLGAILIIGSYLIGSVPFAIIVSRAMSLPDPRQFGSRNPGATNVLRSGNKLAAALTLFGDAAKGWLAVWLASVLGHGWDLSITVTGLAAIAVFIGHLYPVFARFQGGKGVATALGVLFAIQPWLALATVLTWLIVAKASRYSSLAAIMAAIFAPLYYLFGADVAWRFDPFLCLCIVIISVFLCFRHQANIARLLAGKEPRIGAKK